MRRVFRNCDRVVSQFLGVRFSFRCGGIARLLANRNASLKGGSLKSNNLTKRPSDVQSTRSADRIQFGTKTKTV